MNASIQQENIKLVKSASKDNYNVTKMYICLYYSFVFQINAVILYYQRILEKCLMVYVELLSNTTVVNIDKKK